MTTVKQALESAIEAMESCDVNNGYNGENQFYDERLIQTSLEQCKSALAELESVEPVADSSQSVIRLWECIGRWSAYLASNGEQAELSPPSWLIDAVKNATEPQPREWIGLDSDDAFNLFEAHSDDVVTLEQMTEVKLRELNTKGLTKFKQRYCLKS